jgi:hypothetical protein
VDTDLFHASDRDELAVEGKLPTPHATMVHNKEKFKRALEYCKGCSVVEQCDEDAIAHGHQTFAVRGGISPYDRGYKLHTLVEAKESFHVGVSDEAGWRAYVEGCTLPVIRRKAGLDPFMANLDLPMHVRKTVLNMLKEPPNVSWEEYRISTVTTTQQIGHKGGAGWALSVDYTRSTILVVAMSKSGTRQRIWHPLKCVTVSDELDISSLPLLQEWPENYDYI